MFDLLVNVIGGKINRNRQFEVVINVSSNASGVQKDVSNSRPQASCENKYETKHHP